MSTKINPEFYGGENTFVNITTYVKHSAYSLGDLMSSGKYTGGSLDTTATPWGIGKSSMSSDYWMFLTKGDIWTYNHGENGRKNSPLYLYYAFLDVTGSGSSAQFVGSQDTPFNFTAGCYKNRIYPAVKYDSGRFKSSLDIDDNSTISLSNSERVNPITYADYQHLRAYVGNITYIPTEGNTLQTTTLPNLLNGTTTDISKIVRINWGVIDTDNHNSNINFSVEGSETDIPELFKQCYYGNENTWVRPCRFIYNIGLWTSDWGVFYGSYCAYTSSFENVTASDIIAKRSSVTAWGSASETEQVFDDVSYKWIYGFSKNNNISIQEWTTPIETGELYDATSLYGCVVYLDCGEDATPQDYAKAILHEIAFLGLPIITQRADYAKSIGDSDVYLPVFDEHMVTTGKYIAGSDSLTLPNAQWGDIFGVDMPVYDPEYEPETPVIPDYDTGDIPNVGLRTRRFGSHLNVWCLYQNQIDTIITAINDVYQTSADPVTQWQTDFQGANPSDYIVGFYAILTDPPKGATPQTFTLGVIDFDGDISAYRYDFTAENAGFFSFGAVDVTGYGNFLDYAPYTQLELYIPLCGTVELDTAYFMNHQVAVDMYYDVYTMSCVAAISRISNKGKTLYKTVNGNIGAQIPILSKNMGDYQNTIHSLESAHKQNENRLMTSMLTAGAGAAIAIGSGGAFLPAVAGVGLSGAGMINAIEQQKQIDYQLEHTQPTIAQTGVAESQNAFCVGQLKPKLNIKRAAILPHSDSIYSATVGNACCINDIVGNMSGLIVCSNINCDGISKTINGSVIAPTADEVAAIKAAFNNGVVV